MILYIRNMVCIRCIMVVKSELEKLGIHKAVVSLGEIKTKEGISSEQREQLDIALKKSGFELIDEKKSFLIDKIKAIIIELVHYSDEQLKLNLSDYLSRKLNYDYEYLENLFLEVLNTTIEKFFIAHKIERIKELLVYYKLNLTEIAYQLNYNSVTQLSSQFKELTGFSPSHFKKVREIRHIAQQSALIKSA